LILAAKSSNYRLGKTFRAPNEKELPQSRGEKKVKKNQIIRYTLNIVTALPANSS
jgi:hypothetical protein